MSKATTEQKKSRTRYSRQYKDEALASAEREQQLVNENIPRKCQPAEQAEKLVLVKKRFSD